VCESSTSPALLLEGWYGGGDALAVPRGWICVGFIPRKAVVRLPPPCPGSGSWQGTGQVNTAWAASASGCLGREGSVAGNRRLAFGWLCGFAAGQLGGAGRCLPLPVPQFPHPQSFGMCFETPCWADTTPGSSTWVRGLGRAAWCEVASGLSCRRQLSPAAASQPGW